MSRVPYTYHRVTGNEVVPVSSSTSPELSVEVREVLSKFVVKRPGILIPYQLPTVVVEVGDPPDCIKYILARALSGINLRHEERLHLASFLLRLGLRPEEAVVMFTNMPDYSSSITLYQLRGLASRDYKMYSCEKAKQLGLCPLPTINCKYYPSPNRFF